MIRKNLQKLWNDGEGRLLLVNVSNQLENGTVGPKEIAPFLLHAKKSKADFSSRNSALGYSQEELDHPKGPGSVLKGPLCDTLPEGACILRVAPFKSIIDNVIFPNEVDVLREDIISNLSQLLNLDISNEDACEAEAEIIRNLRICAQAAGSADHWSLFPEIAAFGPVACSFGRRSLRFVEAAKGEPVFVAPLTGPKDALVPIFGSTREGEAADAFRDSLGLDHYGRSFNDSRTVLGGILLRTNQLYGSTYHRPTPFDHTSKARFRAVHGKYGGSRGSMGRSADLSTGSGAATSKGCAEVVAKDGHLLAEDHEVLIFYFGAVQNPRCDAYTPGQWNDKDDAFVEGCFGGGRRWLTLERIVRAASELTR